MTGDLLIRISGQGAVYIRAVNNLTDDHCSDDDDKFFHSAFDDPEFNSDDFFESIDLTVNENTGIGPTSYPASYLRSPDLTVKRPLVEAGHMYCFPTK